MTDGVKTLSIIKKGFLGALRREIVYFFGGFTGGGLQLIDQAVIEYGNNRDFCTCFVQAFISS
jgi:hypothetical protein